MNSVPIDKDRECQHGEYLHGMLNRTIYLLGEPAIDALRGKRVAIAGCGGVGGAAAISLARMGVGSFTLADPGVFDEPDMNRQWGASCPNLGRNKAVVYEEILKGINPFIDVRPFPQGVQDDNIDRFLEGADLLIDCLDVIVPSARRVSLSRAASARGIFCITAPVLGFGALLMVAAPDGMPMEWVYAGMVADASENSKLPPGLWEVFPPEQLKVTETLLARHKVPSISFSVVLATSLVSVESTLILLGATFPGWRAPICLPNVIVADPLSHQFRVMHVMEIAGLSPPAGRGAVREAEKTDTPAAFVDQPERMKRLQQAGYNVTRLPAAVVRVDFTTDSWSEIDGEADRPAGGPRVEANPEQILNGLYGYAFNQPVFRGRYAEALLARALFHGGGVVVTNALFPTTRFHLQACGVEVIELWHREAHALRSEYPFKGDLDLDGFQRALAGSDVRAVYLELCVNALGGHPVSMENLRAVHEMAGRHGIPVVLDGTRAFENAAMIQQREPGFSAWNLCCIVREMCRHSDVAACSLTKDFPARAGAFIGTNREDLFVQVRDLAVLAFGLSLDEARRQQLAGALMTDPEGPGGVRGRMESVRQLWAALRGRSIPVVEPVGGHAVYVDAAALLPHVSLDSHACESLANALFLAAGIRAAPNMSSPGQQRLGLRLLRLAIPVGRSMGDGLQDAMGAFDTILRDPRAVPGHRRVHRPKGQLGEYLADYMPV